MSDNLYSTCEDFLLHSLAKDFLDRSASDPQPMKFDQAYKEAFDFLMEAGVTAKGES